MKTKISLFVLIELFLGIQVQSSIDLPKKYMFETCYIFHLEIENNENAGTHIPKNHDIVAIRPIPFETTCNYEDDLYTLDMPPLVSFRTEDKIDGLQTYYYSLQKEMNEVKEVLFPIYPPWLDTEYLSSFMPSGQLLNEFSMKPVIGDLQKATGNVKENKKEAFLQSSAKTYNRKNIGEAQVYLDEFEEQSRTTEEIKTENKMYTGNIGNSELTLEYPSTWHLKNLYEATGILKRLVISTEYYQRNGKNKQLYIQDNCIISISALPKKLSPLKLLEKSKQIILKKYPSGKVTDTNAVEKIGAKKILFATLEGIDDYEEPWINKVFILELAEENLLIQSIYHKAGKVHFFEVVKNIMASIIRNNKS